MAVYWFCSSTSTPELTPQCGNCPTAIQQILGEDKFYTSLETIVFTLEYVLYNPLGFVTSRSKLSPFTKNTVLIGFLQVSARKNQVEKNGRRSGNWAPKP